MSELDQKEIQKSLNVDDNDGSDIASSLSELLDDLADEDKYILFSELSEREIKHLSVIATVGENDDITNTFIKNYMRMKVSKRRKGRGELVQIAEAFSGVFQTQEEGRISSLRNKLGL